MLPEHQDTELKTNRIAFIHIILLNKTFRFLCLLIAVAVLLPAFGYMYFFSKEINSNQPERDTQIGTCAHGSIYHVPCGFEDASEEKCKLSGCCYATGEGCFHSLPARHQYVVKDASIPEHTVIMKPLRNVTSFGVAGLSELTLTVQELADDRLSITLLDPTKSTTIKRKSAGKQVNKQYSYKLYEPTVFVEVLRNDMNGTSVLSSARGPLMFSKNFFEWTIHLNYELLFGLGTTKLEVGDTLLLHNNRSQFSVPFLMAYNNQTKQFHGLKFTASGPLELEVLPAKLLLVRGMFSHHFQLDLLLGPRPDDVWRQVQTLNANSYIPPFWAWGVHFCASSTSYQADYVAGNTTNLIASNVPFDSHCLHDNLIRLTERPVFTNSTLQLIDELRSRGKRFLPVFSGLLENGTSEVFQTALAQNLLMADLKPGVGAYIGEVNGRTVSYVDWFGEAEKLNNFLKNIWLDLTGANHEGVVLQNLWLPDDRMAEKTPGAEEVAYVPKLLKYAMHKTVSWDIRFSGAQSTPLFDRLNNLGMQALSVMQPIVGADKYIVSTSCSMESQAACLVQNVTQSWAELNRLVEHTVGAAMAGLPLVSAPVCGDVINSTMDEELCVRWYQFASLAPGHFWVDVDRSPAKFSNTAENLMKNIIRQRYSLLDYMYTALLSGGRVIKPFFFEYPGMVNEFDSIADQFFLGNSIIASPVLSSKVSEVKLYFVEQFYELWGGEPLQTYEIVNFAVVLADLPLFIRSGHIVPIRLVDSTTLSAESARQQPLSLIAALDGANNYQANGIFMPTQRITMNLMLDAKYLKITIRTQTEQDQRDLCDSKAINTTISSVRIYAHPDTKVYQCDTLALDLCVQDWSAEISIAYTYMHT